MLNRTWSRLCVAIGCFILLLQALMASVEGTEACGPDGGLPSILAFELVRTPADVDQLFGDQPCRDRLAEAMDRINTIDVYLLIPAFVSFLVCGALSVASSGRVRAVAAVAAAIVAGICDQVEDQILFSITADLPGTQLEIDWLFWMVRTKFVLLGVAPVLIGSLLMGVGRLEAVSGIVLIVGGAAAVVGAFGQYHWMMPGIAAGWIALLSVAIKNSTVSAVPTEAT